MNATYFSVPVTIGGKPCRLVCNMRALDEIREKTGRSVLMGQDVLGGINERQFCDVLAALLHREHPDVTGEYLLDTLTLSDYSDLVQAALKAIIGPKYEEMKAKQDAQPDRPTNPPSA